MRVKAFVIPGPQSEVVEPAEVGVPDIAADELLMQMQAVGVGIHDAYFLPSDARHPYPIGIEGAGVVQAVGSEVTGYRPGDRLAFVSSMQPKGGTWAQYAAVRDSGLILPIPDRLGFAEAAAIPVAGNTALRALAQLSGLPAGGSIFVAGGSGAIGTLAIQIARQRGWRVAASASAHNHEYLRSLGADMTVDYHHPQWTDQVRDWMPGGLDGALAVNPGTTAETMRVVKDGGKVITISGDQVESVRGIQVMQLAYQLDVSEELAALMAGVVDTSVHLEIEQVYPFDEALQALERVRTRHVRGKLVLRLP